MTVIVMTKHDGHYYMTGDGRTTQDWIGISSDNSIKVHEGKDCLYGVCGNASAKLVIKALLDKTRDPLKLLKLMGSKEFKDILQDSAAMVATKKHGCYTLRIDNKKDKDGAKTTDFSIVPWQDADLPQMVGSGFISVRTLLAQKNTITPMTVKDSIFDSYKVNHTIGGLITQVKLKVGK